VFCYCVSRDSPVHWLHEPFPTSVVEHVFPPVCSQRILSFYLFLSLRGFSNCSSGKITRQITRRRFALIEALHRICFCFKFLLLFSACQFRVFSRFFSGPTPVPLHLCRLYLYVSSMPVRVTISRFRQITRVMQRCCINECLGSLSSCLNLCLLAGAGKGVLIRLLFGLSTRG